MQSEDQKENKLLKISWSKTVCFWSLKTKALLLYIRNPKAKDFCSVGNVEISNFIPRYKKRQNWPKYILNSHLTKNLILEIFPI